MIGRCRYRRMPVRISMGIRRDPKDDSGGGGTSHGGASSAKHSRLTSTAPPPEMLKQRYQTQKLRQLRSRFSSSVYLLNFVSFEE